MKLTPYHAKYIAHDLIRKRSATNIDKFTASLQNAQVDLNPHQVDAALFAFKSPLSQGALLADEVGLGKTIEAGIILAQHWAEKRRHLLIIAPSNLRKQWSQELADKFYLPTHILEAKSFNQAIKEGNFNPFQLQARDAAIIICSYQFAKSKEAYLKRVSWDLVVIDEAHRLRNVYKPTNKIGNAIKSALEGRKKVLLTATPLQNSILELYGLVSIIDEFTFGDLKSFKSQYTRLIDAQRFNVLRERLSPVCHRTLRRQVQHYINFTARRAIVEEFEPSEPEQRLYEQVSAYLQRPVLYALPVGQRQLVTLILRKLLASSTYAITATFETLIARLEGLIDVRKTEDSLAEDFEEYPELQDEWTEDEETDEIPEQETQFAPHEVEAIQKEIEDLKGFRDLARTIRKNTKADRLFTALQKGFEMLAALGANKKAIIFTESRRTQEFLSNLLDIPEIGYAGKVMIFNGTNNDPESNRIYREWLKKHQGTDRITGSPTADKRAALVDYFREEATIMIATEAAAEGINLQFCSLVVNYDLPWNPQRIEQRIGRCHRYGQKHDVVVVNFLNVANAADQRVYQLLDQKFRLFDGVFGSSDEVLGAIGSGVDFEKRIARIYQECRSPEAIQEAFDALQDELREDISSGLEDARQKLLEHVDEEVREKLRIDYEATKGYLNLFQQKLWGLTRYYLSNHAIFSEEQYSFTLASNPFPQANIHPGPYMLLAPGEGQRKSDIPVPDDTNIYRIGHPLARCIIHASLAMDTPPCELTFDYSGTHTKVSLLEALVGSSGWMQVSLLSLSSFEEEDFLIPTAITDEGSIIDAETAERCFSLSASFGPAIQIPEAVANQLAQQSALLQQDIKQSSARRNRNFFDAEMDKLEHWADDMKVGLQREIEDLDAEIKLRKAEARKMMILEEKVAAQRLIKDLEKQRSDKRRSLFVAQDEIDEKKESLLSDIEARLQQKNQLTTLFTIRWHIV